MKGTSEKVMKKIMGGAGPELNDDGPETAGGMRYNGDAAGCDHQDQVCIGIYCFLHS